MEKIRKNIPYVTIICLTLSLCISILFNSTETVSYLYGILILLNVLFWLESVTHKVSLGFGIGTLCLTAWTLPEVMSNTNIGMTHYCLFLIILMSSSIFIRRIYSFAAELSTFQAIPKKRRKTLSEACYYASFFCAAMMFGFLLSIVVVIGYKAVGLSDWTDIANLFVSSLIAGSCWLMIEGFIEEIKKHDTH